MINKITPNNFETKYHITSFEHKDSHNKYEDPLMKWPIRGLAYTSELAVTVREFSPTLGTLLWMPMMAYFGADIYDKYKNDKTSYNPSGYRGTEQAIFQGIAGVILPTGAILGAQKLTSTFGAAGKTGLSFQAQEDIIQSTRHHLKHSKMGKYVDNRPDFFEKFYDNARKDKKKHELFTQEKTKNPIIKLLNKVNAGKYADNRKLTRLEKVETYTNQQLNDLLDLRTTLVNGEKPKEFSQKMYDKYLKLVEEKKKNAYFSSHPEAAAASDILQKFQKNKILKLQLIKAAGGFAALGFVVKPIDHFVETVIMHKYISPKIKEFENTQVKNFKQKTIG